MANQVVVLVPGKVRSFLIAGEDGTRTLKGPEKVVEYLQDLPNDGLQLLGVMGGPGQSLFARASVMGINVSRIPWFRLEEVTGLEVKAAPADRAAAIQQAWSQQPGAFYPLAVLEPKINLIRELTRVRLSIQDTFRKPADLQFQSAWRELAVLLPEGDELIDLRSFFANPRFIQGAKGDEKELENRIKRLVESLPIWDVLHPGNGSPLPQIKGLGPSIGGSIVSEIGDIRRFPTATHLRAYARFHVTPEGKFPRREKGEVSSWNRYLNRAVWLWSTDQMPRYDHPWRFLYDWKKALEMQAHPETVARKVIDRRGRGRTVWDYTLKHLDVRAKRWVGSQLLNYLWDLWVAFEAGEDLEAWWFRGSPQRQREHNWPAYFTRVDGELAAGLREYLEAEIPKRRRVEPGEEEEESEGEG